MGQQGETVFKKRVRKDLDKLKGIWIVKIQQRSQRGIPDFLVCLMGHFVAIELKVPGEKPTDLQAVVLERIQAAGGMALWTDPEQWPAQYENLKAYAEAQASAA